MTKIESISSKAILSLTAVLMVASVARADDGPGKDETFNWISQYVASSSSFSYDSAGFHCTASAQISNYSDACDIRLVANENCRDSEGSTEKQHIYEFNASQLGGAYHQTYSGVDWGYFNIMSKDGMSTIETRGHEVDHTIEGSYQSISGHATGAFVLIGDSDTGKRLGKAFARLIKLCGGGNSPSQQPQDPFGPNPQSSNNQFGQTLDAALAINDAPASSRSHVDADEAAFKSMVEGGTSVPSQGPAASGSVRAD